MIKSYERDGVYGFKSEHFKIEFSNPRMQAHDDYGYVKDEKDILYYYYDIAGYVKDRKKWKRAFSGGAYDFPGILGFKGMLEAFINNEIDIKQYQKNKNKDSDRIWYTYNVDSGVFVEDYYSFTNEQIYEGKKFLNSFFSLTVGVSLNYHGDEINGLTFRYLEVEDLKEILKCVKYFIKYSIDIRNEAVIKRHKLDLSSWKVENGKLYEMSDDGKAINTIYTVGSTMDDIVVLVGDLDSTEFSSIKYNDAVIESIDFDGILISGGYSENRSGEYHKIEAPVKIYYNTLLYLFEDMPEERLGWGEEEITSDFIGLLSPVERAEFQMAPMSYLFEKYKSAIIDRSWMCRSEHNLPKRVKDTGYHENVYESVKVIIANIQNQMK